MPTPITQNIIDDFFDNLDLGLDADGEQEVLTRIISANPDIFKTEVGVKKLYPLFWAVSKGNIPLTKFLLEQEGADINQLDKNYNTILMRAIEGDEIIVAEGQTLKEAEKTDLDSRIAMVEALYKI